LQLVWPNHLGKIINAERTVNLAAGCGSNQRIFRTTYDYVMRQTAENLENTFAVIQVTDPTRYEFYLDNNDNSYLNHQESWVRCKAGKEKDAKTKALFARKYGKVAYMRRYKFKKNARLQMAKYVKVMKIWGWNK
jgi:hypothetical protein